MQLALRTATLLALVFTTGSALGKPAAKRRELGDAFGAAVCSGALDKPEKAWALKVFDAQIEGRRVSPLGGITLKAEQIERKAKTLARLTGSTGYASGLCQDGSGWAVAMPGSATLAEGKQDRVRLPQADLAAACESYRVDFAPAGAGQPRTLASAAGDLSTAGLGDGVLGVTCQPKSPRWRGPTLWYLYPTGKGPLATVPEGEIFAEAPAAPVADLLGAWVNRVRLKEGLKALEFKQVLTEQAGNLAVDGGLSHDRLLLKKTAALLKDTAELKLLGEDRVRGRNADAMAWLWWNSPRHRALILNPDATAAGIASRDVGEEKLAVLTVASAAPLATAKAGTKKAKSAQR